MLGQSRLIPGETVLPNLINEERDVYISRYTFIRIPAIGCHKEEATPDFPPKLLNSIFRGMRDTEGLRHSLYKNSLPERGSCSVIIVAAE